MPEGFDNEKMVHKANQIALFFASYPHDEAVAGVTDHLRKYWVPDMRRQIIEYVRGGGQGLHELVPEAVERLLVK
ncbi:MAG TPA: formate dehydrogenase subunit delta [Dehalococcoidia bacterium]|nr:formate dehydrogenase subunit delta [Dehalococcoidia bacterium]